MPSACHAAFRSRARPSVFPRKRGLGLAPVLVRVATDSLTYREDPQRTYAADASIVARIKDRERPRRPEIEPALSVQRQARRAAGGAAGRDPLLPFRRSPPASTRSNPWWSMVWATGRACGCRRSKCRPCSTRRASAAWWWSERASACRRASRTTAIPSTSAIASSTRNTGETLEPLGRQGAHVLLHGVSALGGTHARASIELLRSGRTLARVAVTLAAADRRGRIQQVSRLPLQPLADGTYEPVSRCRTDHRPRFAPPSSR